MVLGCFDWCSVVLGDSGCIRKFTKLPRVVVCRFIMFQFVSSRASCLEKIKFIKLYWVVMARFVFFAVLCFLNCVKLFYVVFRVFALSFSLTLDNAELFWMCCAGFGVVFGWCGKF